MQDANAGKPTVLPTAGNAADEWEATERALLAARFVNSTDRHVFLTGKAGTGKTTFLRQLVQHTHKRHVVLAPTGIAALNAKGVTIHSQFLLPFGSFIPEKQLPPGMDEYGAFHDRNTLTRRHPLNNIRRQVLRSIELLIIDEVSMLRADLLDAIDHRLRTVRRRYDRPFGGVQLLLIGDLFQLPPVVKDEEWNVLRKWYGTMHFFGSLGLQEAGYAHIELDKIFRQQDPSFIQILNNLRNNTVTAGDVDVLNGHYRDTIEEQATEGVITLTTHNRAADEMNQRALDRLSTPLHRFEAEVTGDFPRSMYPVLSTLELKEGAQVMFIRNDAAKAYFNGKLARVAAIEGDTVSVEMLDNGSLYELKKEVWQNTRYTVDPVTKEQQEEVLGVFQQYPVRLAWAITVHKSQGLTFDKAIIDVGKAFAPGQVYVALSRLRSLSGLVMRTRIDPSVVSTDRQVVAFSEQQHSQQPLGEQLRDHQQLYLQTMLAAAFDLGELERRLAEVRQEHPAGEFEDANLRTAMAQLADRLGKEGPNTRTFQAQLMRLLQAGDHAMLKERLGKGAAYYTTLLKDCMKELLRHLAQVEQLGRNKEYAAGLRDVDALLVQQLGRLAKAGPMAAAILDSKEIGPFTALERRMATERTAMVEEAAAWAEANRPEASTRSGRKRKRKELVELLDGDAAGEARRPKGKKPKKAKGETYRLTYALLKEGKSLAEVATARQLSVGTIEGHAARGVGEGEVEITSVISALELDAMADWMRANPERSINDARAHFGERFSFGQLRMAQAWLKRGE